MLTGCRAAPVLYGGAARWSQEGADLQRPLLLPGRLPHLPWHSPTLCPRFHHRASVRSYSTVAQGHVQRQQRVLRPLAVLMRATGSGIHREGRVFGDVPLSPCLRHL